MKYRVTTKGRGWTTDEIVIADYLLMPNGNLVFKREVPRSYPQVVKAFASGDWLDATLVE